MKGRRRLIRGEATMNDLLRALDSLKVEAGETFTIGRERSPVKVRATDPSTSHRAWMLNRPRAASQRGRILEAIEATGDYGATADELDGWLTEIPLNSLSTRISELKEGGWILAADGRTRRTRHGSHAEVLVAWRRGSAA